MTASQLKAIKGISAIGAITLFTMGADWAINRVERDDERKAVNETRFVAESIRAAARFDKLDAGLRAILDGQIEASQRLREICEGVRRGCR